MGLPKAVEHVRGDALVSVLIFEAVDTAAILQLNVVLIQAARIEDRYYERGGTRCLNPERLIQSLL